MSTENPKITSLPNGPYYLPNDLTPQVTLNIQKSQGDTCTTITGVALCRCGGSNNKPFCDGTHTKNGFNDKKLTDGTLTKRENFVGTQITIHDNRGICAHAGLCTDNLSSVFRLHEEPWIDPEGATVNEIINTINKCPSGALSYTIDNVEPRDQVREPTITVIKDGPYAVTGGIELVEQQRAEGASTEHYTRHALADRIQG
jgi:uncharacterized Fe-S cluster protein YjdI